MQTQPARNIMGIFIECYLSVAMFGTPRQHLGNILKEKIFSKFLDGKVVFMLNVYDLIITNGDLLANSSNHEVMFPEYSRKIHKCLFQNVCCIIRDGGFVVSRNIRLIWKYLCFALLNHLHTKCQQN